MFMRRMPVLMISLMACVKVSGIDPSKPAAQISQEWFELMRSGDVERKRDALGGLFGHHNSGILKALREPLLLALDDEDAVVRLRAAVALAQNSFVFKADEQVRAQVPFVSKMLEDADPLVRNSAIWAAMAIGPEAGSAVPALVELLSSEEEGERKMATKALGAIGVPAVGPLAKVLEDSESSRETKLRVLKAFLEMGEEGPEEDKPNKAKAAIPILERVIGGGDLEYVLAASVAIVELDPDALEKSDAAKEALPLYLSALNRDDPKQAEHAMYALAHLGPAAAPALLELIEWLGRQPPDEGRWAIGLTVGAAIYRMGDAAIPELLWLLNHPDARVRAVAADGLGVRRELNRKDERVIPALRMTAKHDPEAAVRARALKSLAVVSRGDPAVLNPLLDGTADPAPHVRREAVHALRLAEITTPDVMAAIKRMKEDPDEDVRSAARYVEDKLRILESKKAGGER